MRVGHRGYDSGGVVGTYLPSAGSIGRGRGATEVQVGVAVDDNGSLQAYVKKQVAKGSRDATAAGAAIALRQTPSMAKSAVVDQQRRRG